jgi:hypothetical protein
MPTICVNYYERQPRKHDKQLGRDVPAYKLGPVEALIALTGLGDRARRVIPKREGGYTYVQIHDENTIQRENHYLVFNVDDAQQVAIERITRQIDLPRRAFLFTDERWQHFPTKTQSDYQPPDNNRYLRLPAPPGSSRTIQTTAELTGSDLIISRTEKPGGEPWWWIGGETYPHKDMLRSCGCRWSKKRRQWYLIAHDLPAEIAALVEPVTPPVSDDGPVPPSDSSLAQPTTSPTPPESVEEPAPLPEAEAPSRPIIVPAPVVPSSADDAADDIQQALITAQSRSYSPVRQPTAAPNKLQSIDQMPIGELSGNISGGVYCYGYALHDDLLVYLNLGGPTTAVEAIIARLQTGKPVNLNRWDGPALELATNPTPENPQNPARVRLETVSQYLPEARFRSSILIDRRAADPDYTGGAGVTFIIRTGDTQAQALLLHHVKEACSLPVFDDWIGFLWEAGQTAGLVRPTRAEGGIDLLTVLLDDEAWSRLITGGIAQQTIQLPTDNTARRAFYDLLKDHDLVARLDEAIRRTKKDAWRGNIFKEREIQIAIKQVLGPDHAALSDRVFALAKAQPDY